MEWAEVSYGREKPRYALIVLFIFSISLASAFPLQLLQNGTIIDLGTNETINGTHVDFIYVNDTLYLVPKINNTNITIQNITYFNITNVTNVSYGNFTNVTNITNCTNCNYTYVNETNNLSNSYTKAEVDNKLVNSYYSKDQVEAIRVDLATNTANTITATKDELLSKINSSGTNNGSTSLDTVWIVFGLFAFICMILFFIVFNRE